MSYGINGRFIDIDFKCLYSSDEICVINRRFDGFMLCDECGMCDEEEDDF